MPLWEYTSGQAYLRVLHTSSKMLHAPSYILLLTNESEKSSQNAHKHRKLYWIWKAKSFKQWWSWGQCNIVDNRKLVSLINNDKNKQRWVCGWTFWARQQQVDVGISYHGAGLSRALQSMKGAARIPFNTRRFCGGKNSNPVPLSLCLCFQVFFWEPIGELRMFFM